MKIDTAKIPEFDSLPEAARTAILGMEFADAPDMSLYVEKSALDKKASEAAELSRKLKEKMSAEESEKADRDARWAEMEAKLEQLEREKKESAYKASYLALGYDDKLASEAAKAMADGNMEKVFEIQKRAAEAREKQIADDLMRKTPHPTGAGGGDTKSRAVDVAERIGAERAASASEANKIIAMYTTGGV